MRNHLATDPQHPPRHIERALHVYALFGFAVAQPLYDLLARSPEFLVAHQLESAELIALVALLSLLAPSILVLVQVLVSRLGTRPAQLVYGVWVTLLSATILLQVWEKFIAGPAWISFPAAYALGFLVAMGALRQAAVRLLLTFLTPGLIVFPLVFLGHPEVRPLLFPQPETSQPLPRTSATAPVVLLVFDELPLSSLLDRELEINAHRYPHFAALAREATWFRNATTVADETTYAIPAIVTGCYPDPEGRLPTAAEYPANLFSWLGRDYEPHVFELGTQLCPEELCQATALGERWRTTLLDLTAIYLHLVLPPELTGGIPAVTENWRDFWSSARPRDGAGKRPGVPGIVETFVDAIAPGKRPGLYFLYLAAPHRPWMYLPSGREYRPVGDTPAPHWNLSDGEWGNHEYLTVQAFQRHLLQLGYVDALLGLILEKLRHAGLYDQALIVVTSDHGVSFQPGTPYRRVTERTQADVMAVPLLVKFPGQRQGSQSERNVRAIDVLPTIAGALGNEPPWPVDGRSLRAPDSEEPREKVLYMTLLGDKPLKRVFPPRLEGLEATVERKLSLFGSGEDPESLFRIGRFRDLVGRPLAEIPVEPESDLEALIIDARAYDRVDLESDFVPAHIVGSLGRLEDSRETRHLAIAINGTIRAVPESYHDLRGVSWFNAMVPESAFRRGSNRLEVFLVSGSPAQPRLARVGTKTRPG
ncbi:MAG: sulfatase-like hydrolase/transferase [bacterium]|nr:sulfatase-like hydrolase/transferase [bacterium]